MGGSDMSTSRGRRVTADADTITIHIPMTFRKRGGRKMVVTPDGAPWAPRPRVDNAMVKALARAFRWQRMLDEGVCGTIEELAKREKVNRGYMSRVLRLTLLAPDIVEAILDGRQPEGMRLEELLEGLRGWMWDGQRRSASGERSRTLGGAAIGRRLPRPIFAAMNGVALAATRSGTFRVDLAASRRRLYAARHRAGGGHKPECRNSCRAGASHRRLPQEADSGVQLRPGQRACRRRLDLQIPPRRP